MISKYAKKVMLKKDLYAIYNSYIIEPIFVSRTNAIKIMNNELSSFSKDDIDYLRTIGILIADHSIDKNITKIVTESYKHDLENKITIMYIIPINACNLACKYCFIGKTNNIIEKMDIGTAKHAVDLFAKHLASIGEQGEIFFYGAEPLMNFNLVKSIVLYCKSKNFNIKFSMVSNGLLIDEYIAIFIKENNISLGISIDGPAMITNQNRVYKSTKMGVYNDLIGKISLLKQKNVDFGLSITIAPSFLKKQDAFIKWLKQLDVKNISYNLLHFTYKTDEWRKYYKEAVKFIYKSNNELFYLGFNEDRITRKYKSFYNKQFKFSDCGAIGANQITICPNGSVEICHGYWNHSKHELPNIMDINDFSDLFGLKEYESWKDYLPIKKEKCINCPFIYICGGGCAMQSEDVFGIKKAVDKAFCIYTKDTMKRILLELYYDSLNK